MGVYNHTGQVVADLERAKRFYQEVFGFQPWYEIHPREEDSAKLLGLTPPLGMTASYLTLDGFVLELMHFSEPGKVADVRRRSLDEPGLTHLSISVDDKTAFTSDQVEPRLVAIDVATNTIERTLTLPAPGYGTAPTADGRWLVVPMPKANKVAVVDLREWTIAHVIDVPKAPQEALVRPDGQIVYVSCDASGQVAAIRTSDWKLEKLITAGKYADGLAWASAGGAR